ncbi:protease modulator HflK [Novosphingobium sp. PC22D]|uniref:protease modulator HflK n=1 Tax=Novosphingobium sp. PC22D TaxID=1962403 RepID=UPI001F0B5B98|nr:protease modulator HflK [Novosphingobium sp. PC22D]
MRSFGGDLARGVLAMAGRRSPWGDRGGADDDNGDEQGGTGEADPPRKGRGASPWLPPSDGQRRSPNIHDIFGAERRRGGGGSGGGGGGMPRIPLRPDGKSWLPLIIGAIVLVWLGLTTVHMVGPKEEGIVTTFGKYSHTIQPGVSLSLPWPIQTVEVTDVTSIKVYTIPEGEAEKLMLTSDQNLVDLSYLVRWNIKNLKNFRLRLADPEETVREVAEAAMRSSIAEVSLDGALSGAGRGEVEQSVRERMQRILDFYHAGVAVQGVEIKKADPPSKVIAAFQQVTAAQQDAERDRSNARAWAQQLLARAQGDAQAFDKVYEQYRLAPEVTKRRMYYETMERVLSNNDKVIVEADGVAPYLPLPAMRNRGGETVTAPSPQAQPQGGQ